MLDSLGYNTIENQLVLSLKLFGYFSCSNDKLIYLQVLRPGL